MSHAISFDIFQEAPRMAPALGSKSILRTGTSVRTRTTIQEESLTEAVDRGSRPTGFTPQKRKKLVCA